MKHLTRREMLSRTGMGMGLVALTSTFGAAGHLEAATTADSLNPQAPKKMALWLRMVCRASLGIMQPCASRYSQLHGYSSHLKPMLNLRPAACAALDDGSFSDTRRASFSSATATPSRFKGRSERFEYQGDATVATWLRAVFGIA